MAYCEKCGAKADEGLKICPECGSAIAEPETEKETQSDRAEEQKETKKDLSSKVEILNKTPDLTEQFDKEDIEKNKMMALLAYIIFLIPLLAAKDSPFARFHTNQGLVLFIVGVISGFIWIIPILGWIVGALLNVAVCVFAVIGIINTLNGKAKELPLIGKFRLLK